MLVIAFHEFGHAITACCTGGKVKSISLDPHEGGVTHMQGGISAVTLPAGYLGSSIIGALLIFAGFDIVASKVASIVLGVCFLLTLWWARRDWLTIMTVLLAVGLLVACWFIAHGEALRWVVVSIQAWKWRWCGCVRDVNRYLTMPLAVHRRDVRALQCLGYCKSSRNPCWRSSILTSESFSVMISFCARSIPPMLAFSLADMEARLNAGVSFGPSSPSCLWRLGSSAGLQPSPNHSANRRVTRNTSSPPCEDRTDLT